jgi:Mitochondrial glycoprotein
VSVALQYNVLWQIEDVLGNGEVTFGRKFGSASHLWPGLVRPDCTEYPPCCDRIRLIFSIADFQTAEENFETPQAEGEEGAPANADAEASYPLRYSFTITKVRNLYSPPSLSLRRLTSRSQPSILGTLSVDAVFQEGAFVVEDVSFYKDSKLATDLTAEADWKRRGLYIGPQVRSHFLFVVERGHSKRVPASSKISILTSRRNSRSSFKSVASTRASHFLSPSTRSTRSKWYALLPAADCL